MSKLKAKTLAHLAASAASILLACPEVAAQWGCPVDAQCTQAGWATGFTAHESDAYGPAPLPFGPPVLLSVPQFDESVYATLHGVDPSEIELVAVELQVELEVILAEVYMKNLDPVQVCGGGWLFDLGVQLEPNSQVQSPHIPTQVLLD